MIDYIIIALITTGAITAIVTIVVVLYLFAFLTHTTGVISDFKYRVNKGFSKLFWY